MIYECLTMTGRCSNGFQRDAGKLWHAVRSTGGDWTKAICGAVPGKRGNGWSMLLGKKVTCPRCLKKLAKLTNPTIALHKETP